MSDFVVVKPAEMTLRCLSDALNLMELGIVLLDHNMHAHFINRRMKEIFCMSPGLVASGPHYRELLACAGARRYFAVPEDQLSDFLDRREQAVLEGSILPTRLGLADGRQLLFSCRPCPDGGRILTYADISGELKAAVEQVEDRLRAEMRFTAETLETQGAYLASLAEAAAESSQNAVADRLMLEKEIAERCHLEMKLRIQATTDGLTGALNRSAFLVAGEREMDLAAQHGHSVTVLMIDVDHFKAINDRHGHAGGDLALQHLVAVLRSCIRDADLLGRLGGEEFAIVLAMASPGVVVEVAERRRSWVETSQLVFNEKSIAITISIGISMRLETDRSVEQVVARADAMLYEAKNAGRNQVVKDFTIA